MQTIVNMASLEQDLWNFHFVKINTLNKNVWNTICYFYVLQYIWVILFVLKIFYILSEWLHINSKVWLSSVVIVYEYRQVGIQFGLQFHIKSKHIKNDPKKQKNKMESFHDYHFIPSIISKNENSESNIHSNIRNYLSTFIILFLITARDNYSCLIYTNILGTILLNETISKHTSCAVPCPLRILW